MSSDKFTHLHVHTDASMIDGLGTVDRTVTAAKALGFDALAITDHGTLLNSVSFQQSCNERGIKPIIGMEGYVGFDDTRFHITLLADGNTGFDNLITLNNLGQTGEDNSRPTFHIDDLIKHHQSLVVLSGCPASPFHRMDWPDARKLAIKLKDVFGSRFFSEFMFISSMNPWDRSAKLARDIGIAPVVTNDVHYAHKEDALSQKNLMSIKSNFSYESKDLYLATREEMESKVSLVAPTFLEQAKKGMGNSYKISQKLKPVKFSSHPKLPEIPNADDKLKKKALEGLKAIFESGIVDKGRYDDYEKRLLGELKIIRHMDFSSYFIILEDIIGYAHRNKVWIGPGRGSGAGSLVLYTTGVTKVDPIKYGLSFSRFLNHKRLDMPDVDVDIEKERRSIVIDYASESWGARPVATYSRFHHKSLVHDLSKIHRVTRADDVAAAEGGEDSPPFVKIMSEKPQFRKDYESMIGQIRHIGKHAGGVIIHGDEKVPLQRASSGEHVVAYTEGEYRELSALGFVKYDLLGLSSGSVLRILEEKLNKKAPPPPDGDHEVFDIFRNGDTLGIFQFAGSQGIIDFTKNVSPKSFMEIVAINALYRPGPLDSGAANEFAELNRKGESRKLHPDIQGILDETRGVICYQEQFMGIIAFVTGGTMADADLARKVLSKARPGQLDWEEKYAKVKGDFFEKASALGWSDDDIKNVWSEIQTHTRYSFNKSHAVAYSQISWEMAWWKYYHRADFYAALMSVDSDRWDEYIFDVVRTGIEVVPPDVNVSSSSFTSDGVKIYLPINVVKFMGEASADVIVSMQPFTSFEEFMEKIPKKKVNKRARKGMYEIGAFRSLTGNKEVLDIDFSLDDRDDIEKQKEYMGFFLPTEKLLKRIDGEAKKGLSCGIVSSVEDRESSYGKYQVVKLIPEGSFWSRNHRFEEGQFVSLKIKRNSGKIVDFELLDIGD